MQVFSLEITQIIAIALTSLVLAILTFVFMILNRIRRTLRHSRGKWAKHSSITGNVSRFTLTLLWMAFSAAIFFFATFIQSYRSFTKQEQVAIIKCVPVEEGDKVMKLELATIVNGRKEKTEGYLLQGEQWALEGYILKWHEWLNLAGIHTMYKLTRIRGRYLATEDERNHKPSVFSLVEQDYDRKWQWLFRYGHRLKFVQAVYGNTVYTFPSEEYIYDIFVTTSGFSIRIREGV